MTNKTLLRLVCSFAVWPSFYNTFRNFFSPGSFGVSSLICSNLDSIARAFSYTICTWAVNSFSGMSSVVTSRCACDKVSAKMFSFLARYTKSVSYFCKPSNILCNHGGAFCSDFFVTASSGLWLPCIITFFPYMYWWNRWHPNTTANISCSIGASLCYIAARDFDAYTTGLSFCSSTTSITDLLPTLKLTTLLFSQMIDSDFFPTAMAYSSPTTLSMVLPILIS